MDEYDIILHTIIQREEDSITDLYTTMRRDEVTAKWASVGLLNGLTGNAPENVAKLFEAQLSWVIQE